MNDKFFEILGNALNPNQLATLQELEDFTYTPYKEVKDNNKEKEEGGSNE